MSTRIYVTRTLLMIVMILVTLSEVRAQETTVVNNATLSQYVPAGESSRNFCQDVTIEIDGQFITISTTVTICCNTEHFICFPIFKNHKQASARKNSDSVTVISSNTFTWGANQISVKPGTYAVDEEGNITDLEYWVQKK
ncbi:hypothetical protein [Altibacter sp. HG106]|uniref:hypothetical protein n=1 Tax=Altibacter sp. HG106 TaxID=3023937 RepID=UPI002351034A|nr:hypothetical protein [Altibacter sp. HG106]MDC7994299.1 hypothetical protein [Altibacter sp. HG106]